MNEVILEVVPALIVGLPFVLLIVLNLIILRSVLIDVFSNPSSEFDDV